MKNRLQPTPMHIYFILGLWIIKNGQELVEIHITKNIFEQVFCCIRTTLIALLTT